MAYSPVKTISFTPVEQKKGWIIRIIRGGWKALKNIIDLLFL